MPERKSFKLVFVGLILAVVLSWSVFATRPDHNLHIYFLDVGQGDATLIRTPEGSDILIDGGPDETVLSEIGEILPFWDRKIELVILTHPDSDHLLGLVSVMERYAVDEIWKTGIDYQSSIYTEFLNLIDNQGIKSEDVWQGKQSIFDQQVDLEVLAPFDCLSGNKVKDTNSTSIVCRLDFKGESFLFTGDAPIKIEQEFLAQNVALKSTVLKVGHHGSRNSTSREFLEAVLPEIATISCGKDNRFNHPHKEVLDNLALVNSKVVRTDLAGRIEIIVSDGKLLLKSKTE